MRAFISVLVLVVATGCLKLDNAEHRFCDANPGKCEDGGATGGGVGGGGGGDVDAGCEPGAAESCYDFPSGAPNVGICQAGTHFCTPAREWGKCTSEIGPSTENCASPEDEDCDGVPNQASAGCLCAPGTKADCYDGPPGTLGQGICQKGSKTCDATGKAYGVCVNETTPADGGEICLNGADDDCNGVKDCEGEPLSAVAFTTTSAVSLNAVVPIASGGAYVIGEFSGVVNAPDAGTLTSSGATDIVVAKLRADMSIEWTKRFGDSAAQTAQAATLTANGGIAFGGSFRGGTVNFGGPDLVNGGSSSDGYVAALNADGTFAWQVLIDDNGATADTSQDVRGLARLSDGRIAVVGAFVSGLQIGTMPISRSAGGLTTGYVGILNQSSPDQLKAIGPNESNEWASAEAVAVDANDRLHVVGKFSGTMTLGTRPTVVAENSPTYAIITDGFWVRYDTSLVPDHVMDIGEPPSQATGFFSQIAVDVSLDKQGAPTIVIDQTLDQTNGPFGTVTVNGCAPVGGGDVLIKLDPDTESCRFARAFASTGSGPQVEFRSVSGENPLVVGSFGGAVDFGGGSRAASGVDGLMLQYFSSGAYRFDVPFGGSGPDELRSVRITPGSAWAVGRFFGTSASIRGQVVNGLSGTNGLVVKLSGNE